MSPSSCTELYPHLQHALNTQLNLIHFTTAVVPDKKINLEKCVDCDKVTRVTRRTKNKATLANCSTREMWMTHLKNVSHLLVPGHWWKGIPHEQRGIKFVCKITDIEYNESKHSSFYTFTVKCNDDNIKYEMLWSDVERFWASQTPLFKFQGISIVSIHLSHTLTLMHDSFSP